jgi:hypothetical protein
MPYVYSTASADIAYSIWEKGGADLSTPRTIVTIKGKANVAQARTLMTPKGAATFVTESQLQALEQNDAFKRHKEKGFVKVDKQEVEADKAVRDLEKKDGSAPLTPEDFKPEKKPKTNRKAAASEE